MTIQSERKNLWILTEERPKKEVVATILSKFANDQGFDCSIDTIRILPCLENRKFTFLYEVVGFRCNEIGSVFLKSVSGFSSFVDFLVFYKVEQPTDADTPLYAIEETKTDDKESRNTGVYQRASKFVLVESYYPNIKKIMLYNLKIKQEEKPTATYIFGTKLLKTIGVEILGKELDEEEFAPFGSEDDIIKYKREMPRAHVGNVPISIEKRDNIITISGRLFKSGRLAHDPNIGALSLISSAIRKVGWTGEIIITNHGLEKEHLKAGNKFVKIANLLGLKIQGLDLPNNNTQKNYWKYETEGEKLGTIFIHLVVENFTKGFSIFENHAGCEKGYFITIDRKTGDRKYIPLKKYSDRKAYKAGDKKKIISIPDLILINSRRREIIIVEGKRYKFRKDGIKELKNFGDIEKIYIKKYYRRYKIIRTVVLYGGTAEEVVESKVGFLLNKKGALVLGRKYPALFKKAKKNLIRFLVKKL